MISETLVSLKEFIDIYSMKQHKWNKKCFKNYLGYPRNFGDTLLALIPPALSGVNFGLLAN